MCTVSTAQSHLRLVSQPKPVKTLPTEADITTQDAPPALDESRDIPVERESHRNFGGRSSEPSKLCTPLNDTSFSSGDRFGQYELIRNLGRGGMGYVCLARDLRLGRLVAIKFLDQTRHKLVDRFLREAKTTARCNHENIVTIYEVGEHSGQPFMVLEYLEGQTLRAWLKKRRTNENHPVPPHQAVSLLLPVVRALAYAHSQGIIHRDLKPTNIILTTTGTTKVLDFGIAKLLSSPNGVKEPNSISVSKDGTTSSTFAGTIAYMSPEQLQVERIDHRSDLWALGIILFEMVVGRHPIPRMSPQIAMQIADISEPMPSASEQMPELGPLTKIIDRCLIKRKTHRISDARILLAELESIVSADVSPRTSPDQNPFAGLAAFQETDANRFYGRDRDIQAVISQLHHCPLIAVIGPSGTGKSSLIRAGVIPTLKRSGEGWDAVTIRPGRNPLAALAQLITEADEEKMENIISQIRREPGYLGARLRIRAKNQLRNIVLFVDQFEELYTQGTVPQERITFLTNLAGVADDATSSLRVVLTMRSDFLDRLTEDGLLTTEVTRGLMLLPPMNRVGLRQALVRPLETSEFRFESEDLISRMIDALERTTGSLPLLQFTAAALWENRDLVHRWISEASYETLGGVAGALARHADAVVATISPVRQQLARTVFQRLVTPERTRALVRLPELYELDERDTVDELIQHLVAMRLLVIEGGPNHEQAVELVHESLINRWPTLAEWLDANQEDALFLARLRSAAQEWERQDRDEGLLWHGAAARGAIIWQSQFTGLLPQREQAFMNSIQARANHDQRRRRLTFGGIIVLLFVLLITAAIMLLEINTAQREAKRNATRAELEAQTAKQQTQRAQKQEAHAKSQKRLAIRRKTEAENHAAKAKVSRHEADKARFRAEREATKAKQALLQAQKSEARVKQALLQAQLSEARAKKATKEAEAERDRAQIAAEAERQAKQTLQDFIQRSLGHIRHQLPLDIVSTSSNTLYDRN